MPDYEPHLRDTLLMPSGTLHSPDKKHLFIVCSEGSDDAPIFLVSVCSWTNDLCDGTCILEEGCHEFIIKKSYVLYRKSRMETRLTLVKGVAEGSLMPKEPIDEVLFAAISGGILLSPQLPKRLKRDYRRLTNERA